MYRYSIYAAREDIQDELSPERYFNTYEACEEAAVLDADSFFCTINDKYGGKENPIEVEVHIYKLDGSAWCIDNYFTLFPYKEAQGYEIV